MNRPCGENSMLANTLFNFNIGTFEANLNRYKKGRIVGLFLRGLIDLPEFSSIVHLQNG